MTISTVDTPDADALRVSVDRQLLEQEGCMPCVVRAVSSNGTTVDVEVSIEKTILIDGERLPLGKRVITGVPIMLYGDTTLGLFVCPGIRPGSDGVIIAADRAIDNWQFGKGVQPPPAMETPRHGDFTDGFFYPGAQRTSSSIQSYPMDALTIQNRAGNTVISIKDNEVKITVGAMTFTVSNAGIGIVGPVTITGDLTLAGNLAQTGSQVVSGTVTASDFIEV